MLLVCLLLWEDSEMLSEKDGESCDVNYHPNPFITWPWASAAAASWCWSYWIIGDCLESYFATQKAKFTFRTDESRDIQESAWEFWWSCSFLQLQCWLDYFSVEFSSRCQKLQHRWTDGGDEVPGNPTQTRHCENSRFVSQRIASTAVWKLFFCW